MKDAQQDVIEELRMELEQAVVKEAMARVRCAELERELSYSIHLDDPVVKGLVEALKYVFHERLPLGQTVSDYIFEESLERWQSVHQALAAYNARLKEVQ